MKRITEWVSSWYETAHLWLFDRDTYRWLTSDEGRNGPFVEVSRPASPSSTGATKP